MPQHLMALAIGFALDLVVGDPHWLPHPIRLVGRLISGLERILRRVFPATPKGERAAGVVLVVLVCAISTACAIALLVLCGMASPWLALAVESIMCYQMLATKALKDESMKVYDALAAGDLAAARSAVSMIVGRDVERLDAAGVTRAAVETVAENASDGVVAPLGVFYKAVNTMDSMVGYRNEKYRYFGTAAARFDDVLNFVPARLSGVLMVCAASIARLDAKGAWRIFLRDRRKHASPNSAHTEAACAGALDVALAGDAWYFGKLVEKPTIGDALRPVEAADIVRANRLLYATASLSLVLCLALGWVIYVCEVVL